MARSRVQALVLSLATACLAASLTLPADAQPNPPRTESSRRVVPAKTGMSPFDEALRRGDRALLARDFPLALAAYREAIAKEPQRVLGYYRLAEAELQQEHLQEADAAFAEGLRLVAASDSRLEAKLRFGRAEVRERLQAWDDARARWAEYAAFSGQQEVGFAATGAQRQQAIEAWQKLSASSEVVRERIEKGLQAADAAVQKSSK